MPREDTQFKPGESGNPEGRRKGSKDKFTSLKKAFLDAFEELGGTEGLIKWAKGSEKNKALFYGWITKMLPSNIDITGDVEVDAKMLIEVVHTKDGKEIKDE